MAFRRVLSLATTSGGDGMYSTLEYMLSGAHGLLWPRLIIPGIKAAASPSLRAGNAYSLLGALGYVWPEARVSPRVKEGGGMVRQVVKSCLPAPMIGWKKA
jgi:hypothetical protein